MIRKVLSKPDAERLLRSAFRDDMPAELEEQMRRQLPELWRRASTTAPTRAPEQDPRPLQLWILPVLNLRRALLATCGVAMLISGAVLRIGHSSSFLAESFALRQTASSVMNRLEHVRQMECRVQVRDEHGRTVRYSISWVEGSDSRVELEGPAGKEVRFAPLHRMRASVASAPRPLGRGQPGGGRPQERRLESIQDFLSAPAVAGLLTGQWQVAPGQGSGPEQRAAFLITAAVSPYPLLVVVNQRTYLPVSLMRLPAGSGAQLLNSQPLLSAEFRWDSPSAMPGQP